MLDGLSLDQLRIFVAAAEEGSFSAAARYLKRTQSSVSDAIANLEAQLAVALFDRSERYPRLTPAGMVLLTDALSVVSGVDLMKARAKGIAGGLEAELSAVIDVFFPIGAVSDVAHAFHAQFSCTPLRLYVEALGGAMQPVLDGRASFGLVVSSQRLPTGLVAERLGGIDFVTVAAASHPLATQPSRLTAEALAHHVQLVLTDGSQLSAQRPSASSPLTWHLADLSTKHALLVSGLGWGEMPLHTVDKDLAEGRLVELAVQGLPLGGAQLPMWAIYRSAAPPGPAGRWMIDRLKQCANTRRTDVLTAR